MELVQLIVQKKWNGRKRSDTWSGQNLFNPHFFLNKHFRATPFFILKVQRCPRGNGWKQSEIAPSLGKKVSSCFYNFKHFSRTYATKQLLFCRAKVRSPTVSNRFPLDTFGPSQKKTALRGNAYFKQNDRFRPFHFFWTINWTNSIYGRLIQCKPVQTMTLKLFGATLVRVHCTKYWILHLDLDIQYSLNITKSQELVKFK